MARQPGRLGRPVCLKYPAIRTSLEPKLFNRMQVVTADSENFLRRYLNNASPTGFEWSGQQLWLDYLRPYLDRRARAADRPGPPRHDRRRELNQAASARRSPSIDRHASPSCR